MGRSRIERSYYSTIPRSNYFLTWCLVFLLCLIKCLLEEIFAESHTKFKTRRLDIFYSVSGFGEEGGWNILVSHGSLDSITNRIVFCLNLNLVGKLVIFIPWWLYIHCLSLIFFLRKSVRVGLGLDLIRELLLQSLSVGN